MGVFLLSGEPAPRAVEDAAAVLLELELADVFERRHVRHSVSWVLRKGQEAAVIGEEEAVATLKRPRKRRADQPDRVIDVLRAIAESESGELLSIWL